MCWNFRPFPWSYNWNYIIFLLLQGYLFVVDENRKILRMSDENYPSMTNKSFPHNFDSLLANKWTNCPRGINWNRFTLTFLKKFLLFCVSFGKHNAISLILNAIFTIEKINKFKRKFLLNDDQSYKKILFKFKSIYLTSFQLLNGKYCNKYSC